MNTRIRDGCWYRWVQDMTLSIQVIASSTTLLSSPSSIFRESVNVSRNRFRAYVRDDPACFNNSLHLSWVRK